MSGDPQSWDQIIYFRRVTDCPKQPHRGRLGLGFFTDLRNPLITSRVSDSILGGMSTFLFLEKTHATYIGAHCRATRTEPQIFRSNIARVLPNNRDAIGGKLFLLFILSV